MAADAFLKFGTRHGGGAALVGESTDKIFKDWFQFDSCGFGVINNATIESGSQGAGGGKAEFNKFNFSKKLDSSSPILWECCASGAHIEEAWLYIRKAGQTKAYVKFYFKNCFVNKLAWAGSGEVPTESVEFDFGAMVVEYSVQGSADGALGATNGGSYDRQGGHTDLGFKAAAGIS
jgi:type VI secretion system secreted protein Hcp